MVLNYEPLIDGAGFFGIAIIMFALFSCLLVLIDFFESLLPVPEQFKMSDII
jgi:hypothetical protein